MLTEPGELVLDPFVGTGTTTAVAHRLERRWIGIDNNPKNAEAALDRTLMQRPGGEGPSPGAQNAGRVVH